jgi:hypothetical protein
MSDSPTSHCTYNPASTQIPIRGSESAPLEGLLSCPAFEGRGGRWTRSGTSTQNSCRLCLRDLGRCCLGLCGPYDTGDGGYTGERGIHSVLMLRCILVIDPPELFDKSCRPDELVPQLGQMSGQVFPRADIQRFEVVGYLGRICRGRCRLIGGCWLVPYAGEVVDTTVLARWCHLRCFLPVRDRPLVRLSLCHGRFQAALRWRNRDVCRDLGHARWYWGFLIVSFEERSKSVASVRPMRLCLLNVQLDESGKVIGDRHRRLMCPLFLRWRRGIGRCRPSRRLCSSASR